METLVIVLLVVAFVLLVIAIDKFTKVIGRLRDRVRSLESHVTEVVDFSSKSDRLQCRINDQMINGLSALARKVTDLEGKK